MRRASGMSRRGPTLTTGDRWGFDDNGTRRAELLGHFGELYQWGPFLGLMGAVLAR